MHARISSQRPLTISERADLDPERVAHLNYVLRRYAGLQVYVPRIQPSSCASQAVPVNVCPTPRVGGAVGRVSSQSSDFSFLREGIRRLSPFGKLTPYFGGRVVIGPGKWLFAFSLVLLMAVLALVVMEKQAIENYCGGLIVFVVGIALCCLSLCTFFIVGTSDPGVVSKHFTLHDLLSETEQYRIRHPDDRFYRYCQKCRAFRPPRAFHCSRCDVCIRQQDIHLFTSGSCVGERNRKAFFFTILFQTLLATYLITTNIIVSLKTKVGVESYYESVFGASAGVVLLFMPQTGGLMLLYRIYLICVGRTAREEYRKYRYYDTNDCAADDYSTCTNIVHFFFRQSTPSIFGRRLNRIDPEGYQDEIPAQWNLNHILGRPGLGLHDDLRRNDNIDLNASVVGRNAEINDALRLRELAEFARGRSTPSVPLFDQDMSPPTKRIRMPRKSKPSSILQQQITAFQEARLMPKATVSYHKRQKLPLALSEGCIPRTKDGLQEMLQLARATQLRRIIQMILLRDRSGLMDMSRRVNIAALVGMNRFDPDNLQLLELNNGLPMIAPRRRETDQGVNHQRLGAGILGIPQMVAAGLLPTARDLANSVESMVGRGRIRRLPPVGRQRYIPITVVDSPTSRRLNEVDIRHFIAQNSSAQIPFRNSSTTRYTTQGQVPPPPPPVLTANDNLNFLGSPVGSPRRQQSIQQTNIPVVSTTRLLDDDRENNNPIGFGSFVVNRSTRTEGNGMVSTVTSGNDVLPLARGTTSTPTNIHRPCPYPSRPGQMVVIPVFSESD